MLILLLVLILVFGFGGYRMGPGLGYYGGGGISLILAHRSHSSSYESDLAVDGSCLANQPGMSHSVIASDSYRFRSIA